MIPELEVAMAVESTMLPLGTVAPAFDLQDATGARVASAELADHRALLVVFACNHCPYVVHVADALGALARRWQRAGVAVVAIASNDPVAYPEDAPAAMPAFAAAHGWDFPYLVDPDQSVALAYRAACTPDLYLFDADQRLAYRGRLCGSRPGSGVPVTGEDLQAAIDGVLAGVPVPEPQRPSLGCSIKWRPGSEPPWSR